MRQSYIALKEYYKRRFAMHRWINAQNSIWFQLRALVYLHKYLTEYMQFAVQLMQVRETIHNSLNERNTKHG